MADNVTGSFGGQNVFLENAATEATLQLLLKATLATTVEQKKAISELVQKAGMDPAKVEEANKGLSNVGQYSAIAGGALGGLSSASDSLRKGFSAIIGVAEQFTNNQGNASAMFGQLAGMGGVVGLVASGFQKVAAFQEQNLKLYQDMTKSGVTFSGSLIDARKASSEMYLSMDELQNLIKNNSAQISTLGGTTEQGMQSFRKLNTEFQNSQMGKDLRSLGFTASESSEALIKFSALTGKTGMQDANRALQVQAATAGYLQELDKITQLHGIDRKKLEDAQKEAAANAAFQRKLASLLPDEQKKLQSQYDRAAASGVKGAKELVISSSLGIAPINEAARKLTGTFPDFADGIMRATEASMEVGTTQEQVNKINNEGLIGLKNQVDANKEVTDVLAISGNNMELYNSAIAQTNQLNLKNMNTVEDLNKAYKAADEDVEKRKEAESKKAVDQQMAMQKVGQMFLQLGGRLAMLLEGPMVKFTQWLGDTVEKLINTPGALDDLISNAKLLAGAFVALKVVQGAAATRTAFSGIMGGGAGGAGGKGAGDLGGGGGGLKGLGAGIRSVGMGLAALGGPTALLVASGAAAVGAAIVVIGAGIAGATWLMGKALPTLAEGLQAFNDLDGTNLKDVGLGVIQLGAGLVAFGAGGAIAGIGGVVGSLAEGFGSLIGVKSPLEKMMEFAKVGPELKLAGDGIASFNTSLAKLLNTDMANIKNLSGNLTNLAGSLKELREASKPVEKSFLASATDALKAALTPETTTPPAPGTAGAQVANRSDADRKSNATLKNDVQESLRIEVAKLNSTSMELLRAMRESAENTKKTASILASRGNLLKG
jgi:hypothetical protein